VLWQLFILSFLASLCAELSSLARDLNQALQDEDVE
jgi:hypothetical protein